MSASSGNLDSLLNVSFPAEDYLGVAVQSYTTSGTAFNPLLATIAVDTTGAPGPAGMFGVGETLRIAAVNDTANTITLVFSLGGSPVTQSTDFVLGYTANAILVGGNNSNTVASILNDGLTGG